MSERQEPEARSQEPGARSQEPEAKAVSAEHSGFRLLTADSRSSVHHSSFIIHHFLPPAVSALAFLVVFGWAVFSGRYLIGGDVFFYTYPMRTVAWEMIRAGRWPLWTPHVLSGFPVLAMPQLALGYPLTWGHLFLPHRLAEQLYIYAPFLLAPTFTYLFARETGRSRLASALAGLTFAYGGLATNGFGMNGLMTNACMWLPLLLAAVERARRRPLAGCLAAGAAAYSMSVLTGLAQGFVPATLVALAYALFLPLFAGAPRAGGAEVNDAREADPEHEARRGSLSRRATWERFRPLVVAAGSVALGAGVGAFQIMETLRAQRRSIRSRVGYDFFVEGSFTPSEAVRSFLAPPYHFIEVTTNVSALAFLLALCAAAAWLFGRARDRRVAFWALVAAVAFLLMLGDATPLNRLVYQVPVLNLFRRPSRHAFEWTLALSVLAAYGWDAVGALARVRLRRLREGARDRRPTLAVAAAVALLVASVWLAARWHAAAHGLPYVGESAPAAEALYLRWKLAFTVAVVFALAASWLVARRGPRVVLLACALLVGSLAEARVLVTLWWPGTTKSAARLTTPSRSTRWLQDFPPAENRVYVRANSNVEEYRTDARFDALDLTAPYGLHNAAGYEPFIFARYSRALGDVGFDAVTARADPSPNLSLFAARSRVLDLLNVTHAVAFPDLRLVEHEPPPTREQLERVFGGAPAIDPARWQPAAEFDGVVVLRNLRALPRAWLVAEAESVDGEEALRMIRGEGAREFDPRRTALLEVRPDELPALPGRPTVTTPRAGSTDPAAFAGAARVVAYEPSRVAVETDSRSPSVLVLSEIFYPGWEATVDGEARPIMLTNFLLRGVAVPAGRHTVEMRYKAPAARTGAIISALSLAALLALAVFSRRGAK